MKRRILSLTLAVCMMIGFCIPAWATSTSDITNTTDISATPGSGASVETTLTGTFSYTQIKVSVPTSIAFSLDPTKTVTASNPRAQVTGGEFTVSNYGVSDIYLHVKDVDYDSNEIDFTKSLSDITSSSKKVYFSMYSEGDSLPDLTASTLSDDYCVPYIPSGTLYSYNRYLVTKSAITAGSESNPTTRKCYVAVRAGLGFNNGDKFTIKLTFVVDISSSTKSGVIGIL